jgi:integrase
MPDVAKPANVRAALNALTRRLDGKPAAAATVARKRAVLHNAFEYAVELEEFDRNPIGKVKWTPPRLAEQIDWRVVISPRQMRECLTAVTYVGVRNRGRRLRALYACMYYAALRPAEAVALIKDDCTLPSTGWGKLVLSRSLPESGSRFTDDGTTHAKRGLKLRPVTEIRTVPIPPVLVTILREHITEFGTAEDGRIFQTERGGIVGSTAYGDVWAQTRVLALTPAQVASPLARRPYDLRHAGVSLWLNSGVPATEVAERAGHSVKVLLQIYAKCIEGQQDGANRRIDDALDE